MKNSILLGLFAVGCLVAGAVLATKDYCKCVCDCQCASAACTGCENCACGELECSCELDCKKN